MQSRRKNAAIKKQKKVDNLDDLKQELDIDYHKITVEELYQRFGTHPDTVIKLILFFPYSCIINLRSFSNLS